MLNPTMAMLTELQQMLGLTEEQILFILNGILVTEMQKYQQATSIAEMQIINASNIFTSGSNREAMGRIQTLLNRITEYSVSFQPVEPNVLNGLKDMITDASNTYFTRYGEQVKKDINNILQTALETKEMPNVTANKLDDYFKTYVPDGKQIKGRGLMITRTEVMRAANLGSYVSAQQNGAQYFKVLSRPTACAICKTRFGGRTFKIDQREFLPPVHPRCRCIPLFFTDKRMIKDFQREVKI